MNNNDYISNLIQCPVCKEILKLKEERRFLNLYKLCPSCELERLKNLKEDKK